MGSIFYRFLAFLTAPFRWLSALPAWFVSYPGRLLGLSLPARAGCLVALLLVVCTTAAVLLVLMNAEFTDVWSKVKDIKFVVVLVLMVAIPFVVYYWLRIWLEGDVSRYPDIDDAWKQGLAALRANGLDLGNLPVYLVLGASDEDLARSVFAASTLEFLVHDIPRARSPLRWFANDKGIYVVCLDTSLLSKLHNLGKSLKPSRGSSAAAPEVRGTLEPSGGGLRGTIVAGGPASSEGGFRAKERESDEIEPAGAMLRGTLVPGPRSTLASGAQAGAAAPVPGSSALSRHEAENQKERLVYVCELLRRARSPVCPVNGALVLLPLEHLQNVMIAKDMPAAIKGDLFAIREATRLLCPVTTMVTGMERESGFRELIRRVGAQNAKSHRFGKGYEPGNAPTEENIDAFSSHACGAFEDWVYNLYRERDGLSKPGNPQLYTLLCKIRGQLVERLRNVLVHGFGFDPADKRAGAEPLLFNGCYFAATGVKDEEQAFVKSVFEKILDIEDDIEWTEAALNENERFQSMAQAVMFLDGVFFLALVGMLVWFFWPR